MKSLFFTLITLFTISSFSQSKPEQKKDDKVVAKPLYTKAEKENARKKFLKEVDEIGLSEDVKTKYTGIVQRHTEKLKNVNRGKNLTQSQLTYSYNKIIKDQNQEIKKILTVEQYKKHKIIINRYQNSIINRVSNQ